MDRQWLTVTVSSGKEEEGLVTSGQTYGLNISFTEVNGLSDVEEIMVLLASNTMSDI